MTDEGSGTVRYAVGEAFAKGGVGAVHPARDAALTREVAYKVLLPTRSAERAYRLRFVREARLTAQLEHPNIVPVHDLGVDSEGRLFFTMKRVHGQALDALLRQLRDGSAQARADYPLPRLLTIFSQLCQAVHYAHTRGVLHRDLKPANVMVGRFGETLLMDWGLAKRILPLDAEAKPLSDEAADSDLALRALNADDTGRLALLLEEELPSEASLIDGDDDRQGVFAATDEWPKSSSGWDPLGDEGRSADSFQTIDGRVMGTPSHMSPEQARGLALDHRSDLYSLGVILYEMLTLKPLYRGRTAREVMAAVVRGEFKAPRERSPDRAIDPAIDAVCQRALAWAPEQRQASGWELFEEVESFLQGRTELERRERGSAELLANARERLQSWQEARDLAQQARHRAAFLGSRVSAWAPLDERRRL